MSYSNSSTRLWILAGTVTACLIGLTQIGQGLGLKYALVSALAWLGWEGTLAHSAPTPSSLVAHYISTIVGLLALISTRMATTLVS